jgi:hypothetical protein
MSWGISFTFSQYHVHSSYESWCGLVSNLSYMSART